jgi:translation initiation factor eIF-2B subunit epsilon
VIGQHCTIGTGSVVRDCYIFDGTSIGPGCVIERSIIGTGVSIKENSRVNKGCLVSDGVVLGPMAVLKPFEKVSAKRTSLTNVEGEEDSDLEEIEASMTVFSMVLRQLTCF